MASSVSGGLSGLAASGISSSGVSDIKLKRFLEHNQRLQEQLEMRRISVSEASQRYVMEELFFMCVCFVIFHLSVQVHLPILFITFTSYHSLIKFVMGTKDLLIPTLWGNPPSDPFSKQATGCCTIS